MGTVTPAPDRIPDQSVLAMDNIPLALPVAGVGSRTLAAALDYVMVGVLGIAWTALAIWLRAKLQELLGTDWMFAVVILGLFLIEYGYFAGVEAFTGGRSLGKWALDLRVVARDGGRASVGALLLRNMVRLVDLLVGVWLMILDPMARRLGDRLAGTLVVHARSREPEVAVARIPAGWGAREVSVVESLLRRAGDMDPTRARGLARDLLAVIERDDPRLLAEAPVDADPLERLRRAVQAG